MLIKRPTYTLQVYRTFKLRKNIKSQGTQQARAMAKKALKPSIEGKIKLSRCWKKADFYLSWV